MTLLVIGLALFIGVHLIPLCTSLRARLVTSFGDKGYRGAFAAVAAIGLILIIAGWHFRPERVQLFAPSAAARGAAPLVMTISFVLFAVANMRTHLRRIVRHPMLIGLALWSGVHLLANGDLAGTVLFGSFFAYSIVALVSAIQRNAVKSFVPEAKYDAMAIVGALVLAYVTMRVHPALFGTGPVV
jgi:uncharacterized membrane protein